MATAYDIIKGSIRILRVLGNDVIPTAREARYSLEALQQLLGSWSNDSQTIYTPVIDEFALVANQASYTFGTGGDFDEDRPIKILAAKIRTGTGAAATDLDLPIMEYNDYAEIVLKAETGDPQYVYCDYGFPLATVYFYPVPDATPTVVFTSEKPHPIPTSLNSTISFPPGFELALKYNLAVTIAPELNITPSEAIIRKAEESLMLIRKTNRRQNTSQTNPTTLPPNQA